MASRRFHETVPQSKRRTYSARLPRHQRCQIHRQAWLASLPSGARTRQRKSWRKYEPRTSWRAIQLLPAAVHFPARGCIVDGKSARDLRGALLRLPDCRCNGRNLARCVFFGFLVRFPGFRNSCQRTWPPQQFIEPSHVNFAAQKFRFFQNAPEEACVRTNSRYRVLIERAAQPRNCFLSAVAPRDQFAQQRVVLVRHGPTFAIAFVDAD